MSHELRTPLTHIIGFAEVMEQQVYGEIGNPRYADYASHIRQSGEYLHGVISDVLEMSRLDAGQVTLHASEIELGADTRRDRRRIPRAGRSRRMWRSNSPPPNDSRLVADAEALRRVVAHPLEERPEVHPQRRPHRRQRGSARARRTISSSRTAAAA